jgi:hypothetical protein
MDRDFKAAYLEGFRDALDFVLQSRNGPAAAMITPSVIDSGALQQKRREVQAEMDVLREPRPAA